MASSDSRSNRSLWSACGINIRRRLFLCSPEVAHCMRFELRYCTHTTLFVQSRGHSLHWGLSWGIAHTRLFLCSPEVAHCTGGWAEVLHTHNSFCAVQRSLIALGFELRYCTHTTLSVQFRGHLWLWVQLLYTGETMLHRFHLCSV